MSDVQIYRPIGEGGQISGFDVKLLEMAAQRKTGEQMYEELGEPAALTPARCVQRVKEITQAQDYLSQVEQKSLLLLDIVKLRDALWERIDDGTQTKISKNGDEIEVGLDVGFYNAMSRVLREWRATIDSMSKDIDEGRQAVSHAHATLMMQAISIMFDRYHLRLEAFMDQHKRMPDGIERRAMFEEVMPLGFAAMGQETGEVAA